MLPAGPSFPTPGLEIYLEAQLELESSSPFLQQNKHLTLS
jgi:hypothetical protein